MSIRDENPQFFMIIDMIERDAGESPHWSFSDYWHTHRDGWAEFFSSETYVDVESWFSDKYPNIDF